MKKLFAIVLLSVHLFNIGGYYALYQYFVYNSDKVMNEHIAKNQYNVHDLVEVKIPVNLPYVTSWKDYEDVSGQIQFQNNCYNYVKLKLTADTMYVKCIPNYEKTRLVGTNVINVRQLADAPVNKHDNVPFKKVSEDVYHHTAFTFNPCTIITGTYQFTGFNITHVKEGSVASPFLPPEAVC